MKKITIKDVAIRAQVSVSTVSHALNGTRYVKEETKKKIKKIADELNYKPSVIATGLRKKSLNIIAVFVANIVSQFFSKVISGINKVAYENGIHVIMINTFYNQEEEKQTIKTLKNQFIDGAIFVSGLNNTSCIEELYKDKFPFVLVARKIDQRFPSVLVDNYKAIREVVNYLVRLGHRRIGYLSMDFKERTTVYERFEGYRKGLEDNLIDYDEDLVLLGRPDMIDEMEDSYAMCLNYFRNKSKIPSALICATDGLAAGAYKAVKETGLRIPEDISIVGFDNLPISNFLDPPLTTVKQPKEEMGICAMKMLLSILKKERLTKKWIFLDTALIERSSVGCPVRNSF